MKKFGKTARPHSASQRPGERRRVGEVAHDERGNAFVRWRDAGVGHERHVLEIVGNEPLSIKAENDSHDPYARHGAAGQRGSGSTASNTTRTDLRKLSEWIKMMREMEARKRREGGEEN